MSVYVSKKHGQKGELLLSSRITRQDQEVPLAVFHKKKTRGGEEEGRQTSQFEKEQIAGTPQHHGLDSRKGLDGIEQ